jgi:hypothetical protein
MARDTSRVRIKLPLQDTDGDGSTNASSDVYLCVTSGFTYSGFSRGSVQTTCSETTKDTWENIWRIFQPGRIIDPGTLTFTVDWDVDDDVGGREFVALLQDSNQDYEFEFPAGPSETTGPAMTLTGHVTNFVPQGEILGDADETRLTAEMTLRISGIPVFTAPV